MRWDEPGGEGFGEFTADWFTDWLIDWVIDRRGDFVSTGQTFWCWSGHGTVDRGILIFGAELEPLSNGCHPGGFPRWIAEGLRRQRPVNSTRKWRKWWRSSALARSMRLSAADRTLMCWFLSVCLSVGLLSSTTHRRRWIIYCLTRRAPLKHSRLSPGPASIIFHTAYQSLACIIETAVSAAKQRSRRRTAINFRHEL